MEDSYIDNIMPLKKMTTMFQLANPVSSGAGSGLRFHIESTDSLTCVHKSVFELSHGTRAAL